MPAPIKICLFSGANPQKSSHQQQSHTTPPKKKVPKKTQNGNPKPIAANPKTTLNQSNPHKIKQIHFLPV
jgi:hypothetical protein